MMKGWEAGAARTMQMTTVLQRGFSDGNLKKPES